MQCNSYSLITSVTYAGSGKSHDAQKMSVELNFAMCGVVGSVVPPTFWRPPTFITELELNHWRITVVLWSLSFLFSLSSSFFFCPAVRILHSPPTSIHVKKQMQVWQGRERDDCHCVPEKEAIPVLSFF